MQSSWTPLQWASDHWIQLSIGSAIAAGLYRLHRVVSKAKLYLKSLDGAQEDIKAVKENHLPHLQIELEKINGNLMGLRDDARGFRDDLRALLGRGV